MLEIGWRKVLVKLFRNADTKYCFFRTVTITITTPRIKAKMNHSSRHNQRSTTSTSKGVSFSRESAMIKMISSRNEFTTDEQCAYWYGGADYEFMQRSRESSSYYTDEIHARQRALQLERTVRAFTSPGRWSPKPSSRKTCSTESSSSGKNELDISLSSSPPLMPTRRASTYFPVC